MAQRVEIFDVEAPANTPATAPVERSLTFDPGLVEKVWVVIPDGHAGLTGLILAVAHEPVIPFNRRTSPTAAWKFIEGNDESIPYDLENYPDSGAWSAWLYNTDETPHTWQLRFEINELRHPLAVTAPAPLPVAQIEAGETAPVTAPPGPGAPEGEAPPAPAPGQPEPPTTTEPPAPTPEAPGQPTPAPPEAVGPPPEEPLPPVGPEPPPEAVGEPPALEEPAPAPGAPVKPGRPGAPRKPPARPRKPAQPGRRVIVTHESLPAGGWLPHGARFTLERTDQGQDFITDWRGRIVAPADGHVIHNLSDRPFPDGFGPRYPVVHIDSGPFGGRDWYIGHTTSAVVPGHRFRRGETLAHADQGHREGGGWVELGEAPGGTPGPMGTGARWAHLFHTVTIAHSRQVTVARPKRTPAKPKPAGHPGRKPPAAPHRPSAPGRAPAHHPAGVAAAARARAVPPPPPRRPPPPPRHPPPAHHPPKRH